jgi:glutamyl-tRNA synthetase
VEGVKVIAGIHGFAPSNKEYKANPKTYIKASSDAAEILRIALTGSKDSPNLHEVIEILREGSRHPPALLDLRA